MKVRSRIAAGGVLLVAMSPVTSVGCSQARDEPVKVAGADRAGEDARVPDEVTAKFRKIVAEQLGVDPAGLKDDTQFEAIGADSLDAVELVMKSV